MSIRFLTEEQQQSYGRYVGEPTPVQLARYFHLDDTARQLVNKMSRAFAQSNLRYDYLWEQIHVLPTRPGKPAQIFLMFAIAVTSCLFASPPQASQPAN